MNAMTQAMLKGKVVTHSYVNGLSRRDAEREERKRWRQTANRRIRLLKYLAKLGPLSLDSVVEKCRDLIGDELQSLIDAIEAEDLDRKGIVFLLDAATKG